MNIFTWGIHSTVRLVQTSHNLLQKRCGAVHCEKFKMFTTFCNPTIHCRSQCSLTMALCISTPVLGSRSRLLPLVCPIWKQTLTIYIRGAKMYREGDAKIGTNWNEFSTTKWIIEKNKQFLAKFWSEIVHELCSFLVFTKNVFSTKNCENGIFFDAKVETIEPVYLFICYVIHLPAMPAPTSFFIQKCKN